MNTLQQRVLTRITESPARLAAAALAMLALPLVSCAQESAPATGSDTYEYTSRNYDGIGKYHTDIGKGAFIGSNSSLVAPVKIGDGAYVGSGSVITEEVPAEGLAVARGRQAVKAGWVQRWRDRVKAAKK